MNFIEMRKDFEAFYAEKEQALKDVLKFEGVKGVAYDVWKAAKLHAEEMAKPGCIRYKLDGLYRIRFSWHPKSFMKFHSEDEARTWAKDNGYRVIV